MSEMKKKKLKQGKAFLSVVNCCLLYSEECEYLVCSCIINAVYYCSKVLI